MQKPQNNDPHFPTERLRQGLQQWLNQITQKQSDDLTSNEINAEADPIVVDALKTYSRSFNRNKINDLFNGEHTGSVVDDDSQSAPIASKLNKDLIASSATPIRTQFAIVENLLPELKILVEAQSAFLLWTGVDEVDAMDTTKPNPAFDESCDDPRLEVRLSVTSPLDLQTNDYWLAPEKWGALGKETGIEIHKYPYSSEESLQFHVPEPEGAAAIALLRVGDYHSHAKFVLVFHHEEASEAVPKQDRFQAEQWRRSLYDLILMRLTDMHNRAVHRYQEIRNDRLRTEFMQDVLHQVRNSASSIKIGVESLLDTYSDPKIVTELSSFLSKVEILRKATDSAHMATDKFSLFQIYTKDPIEWTGQDWLRLFQGYNHTFQAELKEVSDGYLKIDEASIATLPTVRLRQGLIDLVVFNLLQNALKYTPPGFAAPISIHGSSQGNAVQLTFTNYGVGIDDDEREVIFDRYYRSRKIRDRHNTGTGIGLYICRKIMEYHGGSIYMPHLPRPIPNSSDARVREVSFEIAFPKVGSMPLSVAPLQQAEVATILHVEDDPSKHKKLFEKLNADFNSIHAINARQAMSALQDDFNSGRNKVRLILLDLNLDDLLAEDDALAGRRAGVNFARWVVESQFDIPIIVLSGTFTQEMVEEMRELGIEHILRRDETSYSDLKQLIDETLGQVN